MCHLDYLPIVGLQELRAYQADVATVLRNGNTDPSDHGSLPFLFMIKMVDQQN